VIPSSSIVRARLTVGRGPLARALAGRLVMSIGAETGLPIDRLGEAALIAERIADLCSDGHAGGCFELTVRAEDHLIELRAGPLGPGDGQRLLSADAHGSSGPVMAALATHATIRRGRDGDETLVLTVEQPDSPG